jgi:hypothetical protein
MYCKVCGESNADGVRFCKKCGSEFTTTHSITNEAMNVKSQDSRSRKSFLKRNSTFIFIVLLGAASYLIYEYIIKFKPEIIGNWIDVKTKSDVISISKNGKEFLVAWNDNVFPAELQGDKLVLENRVSITITKNSANLIIEGEKYFPMDGSQFLGFWATRSESDIMEISRKENSYLVKWKSKDDGFQLHEIISDIKGGLLIGDFYGEKDNFVIKLSDKQKIALSVDPFGEFEPIRNLIFSSTIPITESGVSFDSEKNSSPVQTDEKEKDTELNNGFYIVNVAAVKTEEQAKVKSQELATNGRQSGYLWIPDYPSLSGAQFYSVYLGPYHSLYECEVAVEEYRKIDPKAYGLLVSQDNKRVQINGIGKVEETLK